MGKNIAKAMHFASNNSPKLQSILPATKIFVGNNWLVMLKTSFTVLTLLVFSFAMINAENFQAYDQVALENGSGLAEQEIKPSDDVMVIDLESAEVETDDDGNVSMFTYKVKAGDTLSQIANQFGVTAKNIRQINNIAEGATLKPGTSLKISPVEGIVVNNTLGEVTVEQFAAKWGLDREDLITVNGYEGSLAKIGPNYEVFVPILRDEAERIGLVKPEPVPVVLPKPKPGTTPKKTTTSTTKATTKKAGAYYSKTETASYLGFAAYNCTSYVARKLPAIAKAIRAEGGGHARTWYGQAGEAGLNRGTAPAIGAVGVMSRGAYGHVGIVTSFSDTEVCMKNANVRGLGWVSEDCFSRKSFIGFIYGK